MATVAKQFTCPEEKCAFVVRTNTEYELFEMVEQHAQDKHNVWLSGTDMRHNVEDVEA